VRVYNTDLHTFPGVIWASTLYKSEKPMQLFAATASAQAAPTVSFAPTPTPTPTPTNQ
jgi:LemA protein